MNAKSLFVDPAESAWRPTPYEGVRWKKLRYDRATGQSAVLLRFEPGAQYGAHRHPGGEEYLVLQGDMEDGGKRYGAGSYVYHPPGSVHRPRSPSGGLIFVTLPQPIDPVE